MIAVLTILLLLMQSALATDTDADGYSNFYDADFNQDGVVNFSDLSELRLIFGSTDPAGDLNSDGRVNFADLGRFRALFGKPPGGSARLTWTAPILNEDNTPLTDLDHYIVYQSDGTTIPVTDTTLFVDGLRSGTWTFRVTAVDAVGNESVFSETGTKEIQ